MVGFPTAQGREFQVEKRLNILAGPRRLVKMATRSWTYKARLERLRTASLLSSVSSIVAAADSLRCCGGSNVEGVVA